MLPLNIPLIYVFEILYGIMSANTIDNGIKSAIIIDGNNAVAIRGFLCSQWGCFHRFERLKIAPLRTLII